MDALIRQGLLVLTTLRYNIKFVCCLIAGLYGIHLINVLLGYRLNFLGIYPRKFVSVLGIFFAPFLHGSFNHLFFNTIPFFVLASFVLLGGLTHFYCVTLIITVLGGSLTWLLGRRSFHVGASGLITGYWAFLMLNAYQNNSAISIILAAVCLYYFGGMLFSLFPSDAKSSWESHIFGFIAGITAAYYFPSMF